MSLRQVLESFLAAVILAGFILAFIFWETVPAGTFIAILGCTAVFMSLDESPRGWKRALLILFCMLLTVLEIALLHRDRAQADARYNAAVTREDKDEALNNGHFAILLQISKDNEATIRGNIQAQQLVAQINATSGQKHKISEKLLDLKSQAANLAAGIFELLLERTGMTPVPRPSTWNQDYGSRSCRRTRNCAYVSEAI